MRRKRTSKRRWIARFFSGQFVPYVVLMEWPDLQAKLQPRGLAQVNQDVICFGGSDCRWA